MINWDWLIKTLNDLEAENREPTSDDWAMYFAWLREQEATA
jgi:hypothetical protein